MTNKDSVTSRSTGDQKANTGRVYVAFTPYHLILIRALQMGYQGTPALVVVADEARISQIIPEILDIPGVTRVVRLRPIERHPQLLSALTARFNARVAIRAVRKYSNATDPIYVFNGGRSETLALYKALRRSRSFQYVEDGLNAYLPRADLRVSTFKRAAFYGAYGAPHPHSADLISMFPYAKYHYLVPELARSEAPAAEIENVQEQMFVEAVRFLSGLLPTDTRTERITHLWFLANSDVVADVPEYLGQIERWATDIRREDPNAVPGVKAHPREQNSVLLGGIQSNGSGVLTLPHQLPAELLAPDLNEGCVIRSSLSTFVVTSRFLINGRKIELEPDVPEDAFKKLSAWDAGISR